MIVNLYDIAGLVVVWSFAIVIVIGTVCAIAYLVRQTIRDFR